MKHLLNNAVKHFLFSSSLYKLRMLQNKFYILAYHMISDQPNGFFPENSIHDFERQIRYLKKNHIVLSLEEIIKRVSEGQSVRRCVAITFDDGFKDNYENAYPVLKKYQVPATVFLTTGFVETGEAPWFIVFRSLYLHTTKDRFEIELGGQAAAFSWSSMPEKKAASDKLMQYLQTCPNDERSSILKTLPSRLGTEYSRGKQSLMLSWEQVKEMSQNRIHFGAHTVTHPVLSQVDADVLRFEIECSKTTIENKIGQAVKTFAYPFGRKEHYPKEAPAVLKQLGFTCAVTTEPGANTIPVEPYELKRSGPWELSYL